MCSDILNELSVHSANDILFWVGAGISKDSPTNIPLGDEFTKYILNHSCGEVQSSEILRVWSEISHKIKQYDDNMDFSVPRLETILGCLYEIDTIMKRKSIVEGIKSWERVPPNYNHCVLAEFLHHGANIVTTNFDLAMENAFEEKYGTLSHLNCDGMSVFTSNTSGAIYHVHGCAIDELEVLGATVRRVKKGIDGTAGDILNRVIQKCKIIIFLGYSVSDSFDITPFLENIKCSMLYIQHKRNGCEGKVSYPYNLGKLFKSSTKSFKQQINTGEFLDVLSKTVLQKEIEKNNSSQDFYWEQEFLLKDFSKYNKDDKLINFMGLRYHIGIGTGVFAEKNPNIIQELNRVYEKTYTHNERIKDYYQQATRSFNELKTIQYSKPNRVIRERVGYVDKEHLLMLRNECEYYIDKYADLSVEISPNDFKRMEWLLEVVQAYSEYSTKDVLYVSYIMASLKYASALSARLGEEYNPEYARKELSLALDIAYIEGAIAALIHLALHNIVYDKLKHTSHKSDTDKALILAHELAEISGYKYHTKRIQNIIEQYNLSLEI